MRFLTQCVKLSETLLACVWRTAAIYMYCSSVKETCRSKMSTVNARLGTAWFAVLRMGGIVAVFAWKAQPVVWEAWSLRCGTKHVRLERLLALDSCDLSLKYRPVRNCSFGTLDADPDARGYVRGKV